MVGGKLAIQARASQAYKLACTFPQESDCEQATAHTHTVLQQYCILVYTTMPVRDQLNPSPCRTSLLKICRNVLYAIHSFRCGRCVALRFCRPNVIIWLYLYISGCIYIAPAVFIYLRLYLYISGCTYISPAVFIYLRLYLYISGCIYISLAVFTYLQFYTILTQTAPEDFDTNGAAYINSGCIYISPALLIYLRLYLYISGCIYIYLAVFIYLWLYLYISGCTYISPVLLNFDTNGAP